MISIVGAILLTALWVVVVAAQEFSIRGGNQLRWARGDAFDTILQTKKQSSWFENVTDLSAGYGNLQFLLRHSLFRPSEFGEQKGGINAIDFKQLEFRYKALTLTAGNFYASVGRGLALNLYRAYALNFDNNLEGAKVEFNSDYLDLLALHGRSHPSTSPEGSRVVENDLEGAMIKGKLPAYGNLAGYYFYTPAQDTNDVGVPSQSYPEIRMPGGFLELRVRDFGLYAESTLQFIKEPPVAQERDYYHGQYLALDYSGAGFGLIVDYKDYRFKKFYGSSAGGAEPLAYQNPPIVQREFTTNLLAKHPHLPIFNDEVGFQIEGTAQPLDPLAITANFSRSSRHRGDALMPSLQEEDGPFWQGFLEGEYTFPQNHYARLDLGMNEEVLVVGADRTTNSWKRKQALGSEGTYYLSSRYSTTAHLETIRVEDVLRDEKFWEYYAALTLSRAPWGSATLIAEFSDDPNETRENRWLAAEFDINFLERHNLLLFVGQDRGGLKCTSGRCRYVDPFDGIKLQWRSTF